MATIKKFEVSNIKWDTDGQKVNLPKKMTIEIPDDVQDDEVGDYIEDEISNITGWCHKGFTTDPAIPGE